MASKSRRIANVNGAGVGPLTSVAQVDTSKGLVSNAIKNTKSDQQSATRDMLAAIRQFVADSDKYQLALDAKQSDMILGRIASLLDEVKDTLVENELAQMKEEILDAISGVSLSSVLKTFLLNQVANLFDDDAKKDDIEELKEWMQKNISAASQSESSGESSETASMSETPSSTESTEDNQKGDFQDSTPAENFYTLQSYIQGQFDTLNENLKNIPGSSGLMSKFKKTLSAGFLGVVNKVTSLGKFIAKGTSKVFGAIGGVTKFLGKGVFGAIAGISAGVIALGRGIKGVVSGIGSLGSKIGGAIASPFKKIGGFFSSLNPFKKKDKKEDKKQKLKDRIMEKISKVIEKMWKVIEPLVDKVVAFMAVMFFSVVIPVALIAAKVLLIVGTLVLIGIGLYLAYKWIKAKAKWLQNYITSGQLWEDIKAKLLAAWEWLKDFSGWIWKKFLEFGKWFYTNYIEKYIVAPFKKYVWEPVKKMWDTKVWPMIEPFIKSLTQLKDSIVKAFSAWDTNKSIWENLKNIGSILRDTIVEWWNNSPFKVFYETYLKPFVDSASELFKRLMNLGSYIKDAILDWWNGDSSLGETISNIGSIVWNTIKEWWDTSIFKEYWEKLKNYLSDLMQPLREWWKNSPLKQAVDTIIKTIKLYVIAPINGITRKFASFVLKLAEGFVIKIPSMNFNDSIKPWKWTIDWIEFHPFDFATRNWTPEQKNQAREDGEKSAMDLIKEEMSQMEKELAAAINPQNEANMKSPDQAAQRRIVAQQMQNAAQPMYQLDTMNAQSQAGLAKAGQEMQAQTEEKENYQKLYYAKQDDKSNAILDKLNAMDAGLNKKLDDPAVIPMYLPSYNGQQNSAMMNNN